MLHPMQRLALSDEYAPKDSLKRWLRDNRFQRKGSAGELLSDTNACCSRTLTGSAACTRCASYNDLGVRATAKHEQQVGLIVSSLEGIAQRRREAFETTELLGYIVSRHTALKRVRTLGEARSCNGRGASQSFQTAV